MLRGGMRGWSASFGTLKEVGVDLVQAELSALGDDFSRTGKRLAGALLLLAIALFVLFWVLGLGLFLAVEVVSLWLSRWAAVTVVLAAAAVLTTVLALVGWRRLERLESPAGLVRRRWHSHRSWWESRIEQGGVPAGAGREAADAPPERGPEPDD